MTINPDMPISLSHLAGAPERKMQGTGENNQQKDTFTPSPPAAGSIPSKALTAGSSGSVSSGTPAAATSASQGAPSAGSSTPAISIDKAAGVLLDKAEKLGGISWQCFLDHDYDRCTPATGADGTVYTISAGGYISAVKDGKIQWSCDIDHDFGGSEDDDKYEFKRGSSPAVGPDNTVYTVSHGGYASAVKDGKVVWECSLKHTYDGSSPALGADGTLYSVSGGGYASAVKDGKILWKCSLDHNYEGSSPAVAPDGTMYTISAGGYATAVKDGKVLWESFLDHNYEGSSPVLSPDGSSLLSISSGGYLTAVKANVIKPDMEEIEKSADVTDKPTIQQEEEYIIVGGVKLPIDKE